MQSTPPISSMTSLVRRGSELNSPLFDVADTTNHGKCVQLNVLIWFTVMSPNIARPLTLCTSPSDYAIFNQIKSFLIFSIRLLLEREKQQNVFTLSFHWWAGVDFGKNLQKLLKNFRPKFQMTQTSNNLFWIKFFVSNCWEQPGATFIGIFCKSNAFKRSCWKFCRKCAMLGDYFRYPKTGVLCTSNQSC